MPISPLEHRLTVALTDAQYEAFAEWFRKNYPGPDTVIHKPDWHAPKILRAAAAALAATATQPTDAEPVAWPRPTNEYILAWGSGSWDNYDPEYHAENAEQVTKYIRVTTMADFPSDGNEEARWIEDSENSCPHCGGSGHVGDVRAHPPAATQPEPRVRPMETAPTGEDTELPSEITVNEGAWAIVLGTNGKAAGWIDTHELFAHELYRHHIRPASGDAP